MFKSLLQAFAAAPATPSPQDPKALIAAGNAAEDAGRLEEARDLYRQAVELAPALPAAHLNHGIALEALGDAAAARGCYQRVLALEPGHPFGAYNLAKLEYIEGRRDEAQRLLQVALAGKADFVQAWILLSNVHDAAGDLQQALAAIDQAVRLAPDLAGAHFNRAGLLRRLGHRDEAEASARRAVELDPDNADHLAVHGATLLAQGFPDEALVQVRRAVAGDPGRFEFRSNELFLLNLVEGLDAQEIYRRHRELGAQLEAVVKARTLPRRDPGKPRLRLGFVSGELRTHPVALFLLPVLEHIDRKRFEVVCYSSGTQSDAITRRVQQWSDRWVDASAWKDDRLEQQIVDDGIDVLVDLDGHTSQVRQPVFAASVAPVQLSWVGYLNTSGLTHMHYRVTDERCDPPALAQPLHTERLLFLPVSQWCYRPFVEVPLQAQAPCERNGFVTFGSLNSMIKLTPQMARRWGRLLHMLPDARLVIADVSSQKKRAALLADIVAAGGDDQRVRFAPRTDLEGYYRLMDDVDIALDSYPYGGGTTTFDALWMGVPVLTAPGPVSASRSAASVLTALGLQEWIAPGLASYEACAVARASERATIVQLRKTLRDRLRASPLMDEVAFTAAFQAALERAWRERTFA